MWKMVESMGQLGWKQVGMAAIFGSSVGTYANLVAYATVPIDAN